MPELLKENSPITLVELRPRSFGKLNGDELPDTYGTAKYPPRALPVLHAVTQEAGFTNVKSIAPAFNRGGKLTAEDWTRVKQEGVVGASAISRTVDVSLEFLSKVKEYNPDTITVIGGYHASFDLDYCLSRGADVVVIGEGDATFPEFLTNLIAKGAYEGTLGIAYKKDGMVVREGARPLLTREQLSKLPASVYDKRVLEGMDSCVMWRGRGCPNKCTFCSVAQFNQGKYRLRSDEASLEEWKTAPRSTRKFGLVLRQRRQFWRDDEFAADLARTKTFLEEGIRLKLPPLGTVQLPAGAAKDTELVGLLKRAGCTAIAIGFEADTEESLREMNKRATVGDNELAAAICKEAGIDVLGMFILGMDTDTPESIKKRVDWAIKNVTWGQFSIRLPLVGTPDTAKLSAEGRILAEKYNTDPKYYLYDGYHTLFQPEHFSPLSLQEAGVNAYKKFYAIGNRGTSLKYRLYAQYVIPRIVNDPQTVEYTRFLESIEPSRVFSKAEIPSKAS